MIAFPDHYGEFLRRLGDKLTAGQREYGSESFYRSNDELLGELQAEALDLAGWGYVLFARLEELRTRERECYCHVRPIRSYIYRWGAEHETGKTVVDAVQGEPVGSAQGCCRGRDSGGSDE